MEQATFYLAQFRRASTAQQQRAIAEAYQAFYASLPAYEQAQADDVMSVLWTEIETEMADIERLTQQAQQQLKGERSLPASK